MNRRKFLRQARVVSLSPFVPCFLPQSEARLSSAADGKIVVVLQLSGGNDGLNTVIPFADEDYRRHRPRLHIPTDRLIKLDDSLALHPQMRSLADLLDDGKLAVLHGIGYPNPNRSHFESMDVWQSARPDAKDRTGYGWLGKAAEIARRARPGNDTSPDAVYVGTSEIPVALRGRRSNSIALNQASDLRLQTSVDDVPDQHGQADLQSFVRRAVDSSYLAARRFASTSPDVSGVAYPSSKLGRRFQLLSRIIKLGGSTRIFYLSQSGYDTHSDQAGRHGGLLAEWSRGVAAFQQDMDESQLGDRVLMMCFSEFGRRVAENVSVGTDHGTAGPVFVIGSSIRPGLHGTHPSLSDLDDGDLRMTTDFRSVYSEVLERWLGVDAQSILGDRYPSVGFV